MISMDALKKATPRPYMLLTLISMIALCVLLLWSPLWIFPLAAAAGIVYLTVKEPDTPYSLQSDKRRAEEVAQYNRFVDVLATGNVIDADTTPDDIEIEQLDRFSFIVRMRQFGKTQEQLEKACELSLNALGAVDVSVVRSAPSEYVITFTPDNPLKMLSGMNVPYSEMLSDTPPQITALPVGRYLDGSPVLMNLESRNALLNGNPRSGKSVLLSCLLSSLCRVSHPEIVIVMSPKILDFQEFENAVRLIQDPAEMLEMLGKVHDEAERRKAFCVEKRIKKIDPSLYTACPHITVIMDEFTVIKTTTTTDDKGKTVRIGEQIENEVMRLVAETGFAAISFVLCTQRVSSTNMRTDLRDLIAGNRISFATETPESDRMIFGEYAEYAPCHEITTQMKGVGYIAADGEKPVPFKGAFASAADEQDAASMRRRLDL